MDGAQRSQNLAQAWKRVKANEGAPGIDGMTVEDFPAFAREHWPRIATAIREGTCWHWEQIPQRCTWRRAAAKATLLRQGYGGQAGG